MAAEIRTAQNSFVSGEISPEMYGRLDTAAHQAGLKKCANAVITPFGGVSRRGGTKFINAAKYPDKKVRLFNFTHDISQSYLIEMGDLYIRFYINGHVVKNDDDSIFEVATTYAESELSGIKIAQKEDYIFIVHPDHPVAQLVRHADNDWRISSIETSAYTVRGDKIAAYAAFSTNNTAAGRGASISLFQVPPTTEADWDGLPRVYGIKASDVGARVKINGGAVRIDTVSDKNPEGEGYSTLTGVILSDLSSTSTATAGAWGITNTTPAAAFFSPAPFEETTPTPVAYAKISTTSLKVGDAVTMSTYDTKDASTLVYGFTEVDIGARVTINSGVFEITGLSNQQSGKYATVSGTILYALSSTVTSPPYAWTLLHTAWDDDLGYPSTVFIYQQRLVLAGSKNFPRRIWMSATGNVFNFDLANADANDALSFNVDDNQGNNVVQIIQNQVLLAMTTGGEFAITGGSDRGITPSNVTARLQSSMGASSLVPPCNIDGAAVFVQRAGKQVKYVVNSGYYGTEAETITLSMLSRHLTEPTITDMAYQQSPNSRLFCVLADGNMAVLTYVGEQKILGWSRVTTQGSFISVCVVPSSQIDECYVAVKRTINGTVNTFIEKFSDEVNTDCSILGEISEGAAVWGGLDHLEGQLVDIVADGVVMSPTKVTGGKITLDREAYKVEFGINYTTELQFLFQDLPTQIGTIIGKRMKIHDITLRLYNTIGAVLYNLNGGNEVILSNRRFGKGLLDEPPGIVDSTIKSNTAGWSINEINLVVKQSDPLPLTLISLAYTVQS